MVPGNFVMLEVMELVNLLIELYDSMEAIEQYKVAFSFYY